MTAYELVYSLVRPYLPVLYSRSHVILKSIIKQIDYPKPLNLLDVGGRKSPYTIGLSAHVTIVDKLRENEIQKKLNLGLPADATSFLKKRSNIKNIIYEDMTQSSLPDQFFDGVMSVEVIEHVLHDDKFLEQMARVLKPKGFVFLTTPNGDYIKNVPPNYNPDHIRHYTKRELQEKMEKYFKDVKIDYAVKMGRYRGLGLRGMDGRKPFRVLRTMLSNRVNLWQSQGLEFQASKTAHLFAIGYKK